MIALDELVNLYKLANTQARNVNYEQILRILNDSLQGTAVGLGFVLGGTPEFLLDTRRSLDIYPPLQSLLTMNTFAVGRSLDHTFVLQSLMRISYPLLYFTKQIRTY